MTNILCIESSGAYCSLALAAGDQQFADHRELGRRHNEFLLPMLDALMAEAGLRPIEIDLVGFGCGPGSFTGVRIAAAASQAVALAADCRVVPVPTPDVLSATARLEHPDQARQVVAIRSRGQAYYLAAYDGERQIHPARLYESMPDWAPAWQDGARVGQMPPWWPGAWRPCAPSAVAMVALVRARADAGLAVPPEQALPVYLEADSPWRKQSEMPSGGA